MGWGRKERKRERRHIVLACKRNREREKGKNIAMRPHKRHERQRWKLDLLKKVFFPPSFVRLKFCCTLLLCAPFFPHSISHELLCKYTQKKFFLILFYTTMTREWVENECIARCGARKRKVERIFIFMWSFYFSCWDGISKYQLTPCTDLLYDFFVFPIHFHCKRFFWCL